VAGLLRRDRQVEPRARHQDDQNAGRGVRYGVGFRDPGEGAGMTREGETAKGALGLEAVSISKRFGDVLALDDVSLRVAPGSFHALLGENGAGKSTLVKCVMGYYRPDAGQVVVGGHVVESRGPRHAHALGLGMVYQHFTLVENMTVLENVVLAR